jgi:hypothetical protein
MTDAPGEVEAVLVDHLKPTGRRHQAGHVQRMSMDHGMDIRATLVDTEVDWHLGVYSVSTCDLPADEINLDHIVGTDLS